MIQPTRRFFAIAVLAIACFLPGRPAFAAAGSITGPNIMPFPVAERSHVTAVSMEMFRERMAQWGPDPQIGALRPANGTPTGSLGLLGEIAGEWTRVDGYVTFTQHVPELGFMQILLRGYEATRDGTSNRYRADWDRRIYWLNFDGDGPGIPYLMGSLEWVSNYVPAANDPFPEFNGDANVLAECTPASPCSINVLPYVLYRDPVTDYTGYPDKAADSDFLFVTNADGDAVAVSLDLYDANGQPNGQTSLNSGDELQLSTIGYKLDEPGFVYIVGYMDFVTIDTGVSIERQYYLPGKDFIYPNIVNLNLGARKLKFLLDAYVQNGSNRSYAFGGPFALGFNWIGVPDFLFRGNMEALVPDATSMQAAPPVND